MKIHEHSESLAETNSQGKRKKPMNRNSTHKVNGWDKEQCELIMCGKSINFFWFLSEIA